MAKPEEAPWLALYPPHVPHSAPAPTAPSLVHAWRERVASDPHAVAVRYFDGVLTATEVEDQSDALAAGLQGLGVCLGDRVGLYLQNVPAYPVALLALWKLGAAALALNPMYRGQELRRLLDDSGACGLICSDGGVDDVLAGADGSSVRWILSASPLRHQTRDDARVLPLGGSGAVAPDGDLYALIGQHAGRRAIEPVLSPDAVALLAYTSGTTGPVKGAMNTHGNVLAVVGSYGTWIGLSPGDVILGIAPLFHITGAIINATIALLSGSVLVLAYRFHPQVVLEAIAEHRVTFTIGSITAFNAILQLPEADRENFSSIKSLYSGGAPIPPSTVERFQNRCGVYLHNVYGMTETTSAVIAVPLGTRAPVHGPSGTLSVGVPLPGLTARIVDPAGNEVPPGVQGELELRGPQVVPGYWEKPEATASTMPHGRLRTGDGAIMDEDGWVYLVDRLKDQINVSGFKVWPREVEDALYEHAAVLEAAVVGRTDDYQGESVVAYVSLRAGAAADPQALRAFVRERLAPYKCPREVYVLDELPKTQTGKIRRNVLRQQQQP